MLASHFKAVSERGTQANIVALLAGIDTGLHLSGSDLLHDNLQFFAIRESAICLDTQACFSYRITVQICHRYFTQRPCQ
jgi:hypothetical protein